eukprot:UN08982
MTKLSKLTLALILGGVTSTSYAAEDLDSLQSQLKLLKQQMQQLENKLADEKQNSKN